MDDIRKPDGFEAEKLLVMPEYVIEELMSAELTRSLHITDIGYFPRAQYHYRERPEGCNTHIFIFCADGEGWVDLGDGDMMRISRRQMVVIPAGRPHRYGASEHDPWTIYWFHLQGNDAGELIRLYGLDRGGLELSHASYAELVEIFDECCCLLEDKPFSLQVLAHAAQSVRRLLSGIGMAAAIAGRSEPGDRHLERTFAYMTERLDQPLTLEELARHTGVSRQHLIHLFKQETGVPPIEYFLRLKMRKAAQLLHLTGMSVKEVAAAVGIDDPYYFSRLFRKRMGCSPSSFRSRPKG
jgi:AraC-like DNA-binding protein/mannose-6-phosphate isomerase-like protein (cupin superfamily)